MEPWRNGSKPKPAHRRPWLICTLGYALLVIGCGPARSSSTFADRFAVVAGGGAHDSFQQHTAVVRKGKQEDATILVAPITVRAELAGYYGKLWLRLLATPVFNIGDGIQMDVFFVNGSNRTRICSRYFDAGRNAADRQWIALEIPLDLRNEQGSQVEVQVSGGPQGDLVADWLALAGVGIDKR